MIQPSAVNLNEHRNENEQLNRMGRALLGVVMQQHNECECPSVGPAMVTRSPGSLGALPYVAKSRYAKAISVYFTSSLNHSESN
jgi:hypothetical protein